MRDVTEANITDAVVRSMENMTDGRAHEILSALVRHLHAFAREVQLRPEEWKAGIDFLYASGEISSPVRNEFILLSDTIGLSSLIDLLNQDEKATESSVLGPFYIPGAPMIDNGGDLIRDNEGAHVVMSGTVRDPDNNPIPGAMLDLWQSADNGMYSNEDPDQADDNLRGRLIAGDEGDYRFTTIKPGGYRVPGDGPVGDMLALAKRHCWRPAHIHFKVTADGYTPLVTELYISDDPYIEQDAVFGVRESLTLDFTPNESQSAADEHGLKTPFYDVPYDFTLVPEGD